jgi:hypothetical protein
MDDASRRFTDREVAAVLRKAVEIDERRGREAGHALSREDLREIAREVGISPDAVDEAVRSLAKRGPSPGLLAAPLTQRAVHDVPGELDRAELARLLRVVDERADGAGNATEALGAVRWTSEDTLSSLQISLTPEAGRTRIQVVEKTRPRLRRIMHLVPAAWGAMLAGAAVSALQPGTGGVVAMAALGVAGGLAAGRAAWTFVSARSRRKVAALARAVVQEAELTALPAPSLPNRNDDGPDLPVGKPGP